MTTKKAERRYARIATQFPIKLLQVDQDQVAAIATEIESVPSVWAPTDEAAIRQIAAGGALSADARLSRAVLELCDRLAGLQALLDGSAADMQPGTILELSVGGGKLETLFPLSCSECLEIRLLPNRMGVPSVRALVETTGSRDDSPFRHGFRFRAIHAADHDRLTRMIYALQRDALRNRNS